MKKHPFLIFLATVGVLVLAALWFIQSARFARIVKRAVARHLPADIGLAGDFSEFAIKLYPPGVSIRNPRITAGVRNIVALPVGSEISAEKIDLNFRLFQVFSGSIRIHEVVVVNGDLRVVFDPSGSRKSLKKESKSRLRLEEMLNLRVEALALENTRIRIELADRSHDARFFAETVRVGRRMGKGGAGYELSFSLRDIAASFLPEPLEYVRGLAHVAASRINIEALHAKLGTLEARATGQARGDVFDPKTLLADLDVTSKGEIKQLGAILGSQPVAEVAGAFEFSGKVSGPLQGWGPGLSVTGKVAAQNVRYERWRAERVDIKAAWEAKSKGRELNIETIGISSQERPRVGGTQAGEGGKVEVGPLRLAFPLVSPVKTTARFERAHVHWLAAPVLEDVYPLDFRLSGEAGITFSPAAQGRKWETEVSLSGVSASEFQLDNQRFRKNKPLRRLLRIPRISLEGPVVIDPSEVRVRGVSIGVRSEASLLKLTGSVNFKTGYDLQAEGVVNLGDVGEIAENEIRGEGSLKVKVHGPSSNVVIDFDADVKNAYYLNLFIGDLRGRITWDDDPEILSFKQVALSKGKTRYTGDGFFDFSKEGEVDLKFRFPAGDINDVSGIFDSITGDLWWFPRALTGPMSGEMRVFGPTNLKALQVVASVSGNDWDYFGERFRTVNMRGGYDKGRYYVSDMNGTKLAGRFSGRISYGADSGFDWELRTDGITVGDVSFVARLDVPLRGKLSVSSSGKGTVGEIESVTEMRVSDFVVRGVPMPGSFLSMRTKGGIARINGIAFDGQGSLEVDYDFKTGGQSRFKCELRSLDFSPIILLLNPATIHDRALSALVSGSVQLDFTSGHAELASGRIAVSEYVLAKSNSRFSLVNPVDVHIAGGSFDLESVAIKGEQGQAGLSLHSRKSELDGSIKGFLDASFVEFFTSSVSRSAGTVELDFALSGSIKEPNIFGNANLIGVTLKTSALDSPLENLSGTMQLRQNVVHLKELQADLAGGRLSADGTVEVFSSRYPSISVKSVISAAKIKIYPFQYVKASGKLHLHGSSAPYVIDGAISVESALSREKMLKQKQRNMLRVMKYAPPLVGVRASRESIFKLDISVASDGRIVVQNDLFDAELKGRVTVVNTPETPRILGVVDLVQGKMMFRDRIFQIQSMSANFDNPVVLNPSFSLTANTDVSGIKIQLFASGRLDNWKVDLSSTPAMPEPELVNLLALGMTSSEARKFGSGNRSIYEQSEAWSLLLHSLDFNREVQHRTGFEIELDETARSQQGTSAFRPQTETETGTSPKIVIKKRIGKKLDLSYGRSVGVGATVQNEVNAELRVNPGFSVLGVWDNYETETNEKNRKSYGLDLKWQKKFR